MIQDRGQDQLVNVAQRNSVYQALDRLVRDGLARPAGTTRDAGRPERTTYEVTDSGAATMPDLASRRDANTSLALLPMDETIPSPVTTTRRIS